MGIRNKVGTTGWISEKISGTSAEIDMSNATETVAPKKGMTFAQTGSVTSITAPVAMLGAGAVGTTASLPAIGSSNVGKMFLIFSSGSAQTLISGSNTINGGAWTRSVSPWGIYTFIAYSSSLNGYGWVANSGSAL